MRLIPSDNNLISRGRSSHVTTLIVRNRLVDTEQEQAANSTRENLVMCFGVNESGNPVVFGQFISLVAN